MNYIDLPAPREFTWDYSIAYSLYITFVDAFEFLVFQRVDTSANNANIFSVFHVYDPTISAFRTKVCVC